jgi:hypothetical protein
MIVVHCQSCGQKTPVPSYLTAAEEPCNHCGQLLMGALEQPKRVMRPVAVSAVPSFPVEHIPSSKSRVLLGIILGGFAGLAAVYFLANFGAFIPLHVRGAILGAFAGVLLAPLIALALFVYMLVPILNLSLLGVLGDCTWSRISDALNQRRLRPLAVPLFIFVVLPMAACGLGGSKTKATTAPLHAAASLGALAFGAISGGIAANVARTKPPRW